MAARMSQLVAGLLLGLPAVFAQTSTDCNPLTASCPSDPGLPQSTYSFDFTKGAGDSANWAPLNQWTGGVTYTSNGAEFTIHQKGDSPTIITNWYIFFGRIEVHMRASWGQGIVSSSVLESDDLDEIDWEFIGGDNENVQTNYFGKGDTSTYDRGKTLPVGDVQGTSHNYTIDWTPQAITWYVNGAAIRTLNYGDAKGGAEFPQTPMRLRLGIWAGGDPNNAPGTIEWAGGLTDYSKAPFTMYVESVSVTNYNPAGSYSYSDNSGSWQSIKFAGAVSQPSSSSSKSTTTAAPPSSSSTLSTSTTTSTTTTTPPTTSTSSPAGNASGAPQLATVGLSNTTTTTTTSSTSTSSAASTTSSTATTPNNAAGHLGALSSLFMAAPLALLPLFL